MFVVLLALACAGLVTAAALVPAPPAMLPFVVATGIGCPMLAALELPKSLAVLRRGARARRALLAEMRVTSGSCPRPGTRSTAEHI